jgi:demethylmenaquinone methyltransferase/2-methoxy-6-polyprenyl-1,4-benzoquinol methylase
VGREGGVETFERFCRYRRRDRLSPLPQAPNLRLVGTRFGNLPVGAEKRARVREMFDTIAPRYDLLNRLMTFGLDRRWRHRTLNLLALEGSSIVADVGCGTGDLARGLVEQGHQAFGIDMSLGMLHEANSGGAPLVLSDAAMLPLGDATIDAAVSAFALRNFAELVAVIVELARVVRPGGRIALLDVAQPEGRLLKAGYSVWFNHAVPRIGGLLSDRAAYRYLPASIAYLPRYEELAGMLGDAGFSAMRRDLLTGGVVQVITATRSGVARVARRHVLLAEDGA